MPALLKCYSQFLTTVDPSMKCKTPNCPRPRYKQPKGDGYFDYCSISCRDAHQGKKVDVGEILASGTLKSSVVI